MYQDDMTFNVCCLSKHQHHSVLVGFFGGNVRFKPKETHEWPQAQTRPTYVGLRPPSLPFLVAQMHNKLCLIHDCLICLFPLVCALEEICRCENCLVQAVAGVVLRSLLGLWALGCDRTIDYWGNSLQWWWTVQTSKFWPSPSALKQK